MYIRWRQCTVGLVVGLVVSKPVMVKSFRFDEIYFDDLSLIPKYVGHKDVGEYLELENRDS